MPFTREPKVRCFNCLEPLILDKKLIDCHDPLLGANRVPTLVPYETLCTTARRGRGFIDIMNPLDTNIRLRNAAQIYKEGKVFYDLQNHEKQ